MWVGVLVGAAAAAPLEGFRIVDAWGPSRVRLGTEAVVGEAGGSSATAAALRWSGDGWFVDGSLPVVAFTTPGGRDVALGNLHLTGGAAISDGWTLGVRARVPLGSPSWTWVERAETTWPGGGADLWAQGRTDLGGAVGVLRLAAGWTTTGGYEPFPANYAKLEVAGAVVMPLGGDVFSATAETALAWWDVSPWEVSLLAAAAPEGFVVRAGVVLPVLVWAGASPVIEGAGVREATVVVDLAVPFG